MGARGMTALLLVSVLAFGALLRAAALLVPNISVVQLRAICACAARPDDRPFHYHQLGLSIFPSKASGAAHIAAMAKPAARAPGTRGRAQNQRAQRGSRTSRATFAGTKELLAYVSHDLRAPVSAIIAYLQLMHQSPNKVDTDKLAAIERSAAYQLALIDEPGGLCQR